MAINFPNSPTNGQIFTSGGKSYEYNSTTGVWNRRPEATSPVPADVSDLTDTTNLLFDGQYSSLAGAPTSSTAGALGTLTKTFTQNEETEITLSENISPVPNVSVFKEVPQEGLTSKGNWDVNANATNYEFFDEKSISYSSATLTPSATGDGTFTSSNPTILHNQFSLIPDHGTTQNTYATTGMSNYYINTGINDGASPQSSSVAVSPDGTKAIVLQWNTNTIGKQRLHSWNLQTAFGVNSAYVFQEAGGYDPVNSMWLHQGYYDVSIGGTTTAYRFGHAGIDPSGVHFYFHRNTTTYYYKASTAWDVTTLTYQNKTFTPTGNGVTASNYLVQGAEVSSNGSYLIYCSGNYVATYTMSTAFDASTATPQSKQEVDVISILTSAGLTVTGGLRSAIFNSDGTELLTNITYSGNEHKAYKFTLSTAWDITTASYVQNSESSNSGRQLRFFEQSNSDNTWVSYTVNGTSDVAIVQLDESLQFLSKDVGKKVVGNSGSALITSTAGAYTSVTSFADTSAISSWQLFGADGKSDGTGITLSGISTNDVYNLSAASYDNKSFDASSQLSGQFDYEGITFKDDGTAMYLIGFTNDTVYQFTLTTAWDVSTASYSNKSFSVATQDGVPRDIRFKSDGTSFYVIASSAPDSIYQYNLTTAWDVSTASYSNKSFSVQTQTDNPSGLAVSADGTKFYVCHYGSTTSYQYDLTTAWDISTASYSNKSFTSTSGQAQQESIDISSDGLKFFVCGTLDDAVLQYDLSTAWDISTASTTHSASLSPADVGLDGVLVNGWYQFMFSATGHKLYSFGNTKIVYQISTGAGVSYTHPYSQYFPTLTNSTGQINSSSWTDINSMTADETKNGGDIFYAVSTDNRTSWAVIDNTNGVRNIVKNNSGTWQYNNSSSYSSEIWVNGTNNNEHATLQEALEAQAFNRMDKAQLDAVTDPNHYVLGDTLDLMIAPYATSGTSPLSDGVSIGYDASVLVRQAINGTDYEAEFPALNKVKIKSLAAQNLKIRVI